MKLSSLLLTGLLTLSAHAISSYDVAKKSDAATSGFKDAQSIMQMTLVNAHNQKRERTMKMKILEGKGSDGDKSLMEFLSPSDVKGTKFLSYQHINRDDDQWLYLPALKRVKRIASKNKSGSFMGSEFSYEDLNAFNADKYNYNGEAKSVTLEGKKYYKTISTPKSKYSGYKKQISYVGVKNYLLHRVEYYDRKGALLKVATFSGYKKTKGVWRIGKIEMKNMQNDKSTTIEWKKEKIKTGLKARDFHKRVLKK